MRISLCCLLALLWFPSSDARAGNWLASCGGYQQSIGMMVLDRAQPFVSAQFAQRLGFLMLEDRYPDSVFVVDGEGLVADEGEAWAVTFRSQLLLGDSRALPERDGVLLPRTLTLRARKCDGGILEIFQGRGFDLGHACAW